MSTTEVYKKRKMNFEFELSKGKQNSLGETLKVVDFIKKNPKKVNIYSMLLFRKFTCCNEGNEWSKENYQRRQKSFSKK